jgi:hypothetical protein
MPISYIDNFVSQDKADALHSSFAITRSEGSWRMFLHYAQLRREQQQGYHFQYLTNQDGVVCTCGLVIGGGDELLPLFYPNEDLGLEPMQMLGGHRKLPEYEGTSVALIVNYRYVMEVNDYVWTAYCQVCGKFVRKVRQVEATSFVEGHNSTCQK